MTFTRIVAPLRRRGSKARISVSWHSAQHGNYSGRLSSAATRLVDSWGYTEEVGIVTYAGDGEDAGRFALDFVGLSKHEAAVPLRVYPYSQGAGLFASGALAALTPSGKSLLEHIPGTTMLAGWVHGHEPPGTRPIVRVVPRPRTTKRMK